jgi:hypothetical protein
MSEIDKPGDNGIVADRFRKRCFVRQLEREMAISSKSKLWLSNAADAARPRRRGD